MINPVFKIVYNSFYKKGILYNCVVFSNTCIKKASLIREIKKLKNAIDTKEKCKFDIYDLEEDENDNSIEIVQDNSYEDIEELYAFAYIYFEDFLNKVNYLKEIILPKYKYFSNIDKTILLKNIDGYNDLMRNFDSLQLITIGDIWKANLLKYNFETLLHINKIIDEVLKYKTFDKFCDYSELKNKEKDKIICKEINDFINNCFYSSFNRERIFDDREIDVLKLYFGLDKYKEIHTITQIASIYNLSRERIRQIFANSMRKLRNPKVTKNILKLIDYMYLYRNNDFIYCQKEIEELKFSNYHRFIQFIFGINGYLIKINKDDKIYKIYFYDKLYLGEYEDAVHNAIKEIKLLSMPSKSEYISMVHTILNYSGRGVYSYFFEEKDEIFKNLLKEVIAEDKTIDRPKNKEELISRLINIFQKNHLIFDYQYLYNYL